jgi:hypothetical protein
MEQLTKKLKIANTSETTLKIKVEAEKGTKSYIDQLFPGKGVKANAEETKAEPR